MNTMELQDKLSFDEQDAVAEAELDSKRQKTKWGAEIDSPTK